MIVSLIRKNRLVTLNLPNKVNGHYWIEDFDEKGNNIKVIGIEAIDGNWYIKSNKFTKIISKNGQIADKVKLEELTFYKLSSIRDYTQEFIYTEPDTVNRAIFNKYIANEKADFTIGRDSKNSIHYDNHYVSSCHAVLSYDGIDSWSVTDENSSNGTYVNGNKVTGKINLESGDILYILGLKIIIGGQFFAINNPDSKVKMNSVNIIELPEQTITEKDQIIENESDYAFYFRSPKFQRSIETFKMKVDAPPQKEKQEEMPLAFIIGPSMTMGIASIFTAMSSIVNYMGQDPSERNFLSILPTVAMAVGMLAGTMLWPILTKKAEKKKKIAKEKERKKKYVAYLNECREAIQKASDNQKSILIENNPSIEQIASSTKFWEHNLWSRQYGQHDFLNVRIGNGDVEFDSDIQFPEKSFSIDDDDLIDEVNKMASNNYSLKNVPVIHSLYNTKITGVASHAREKTLSFINNIILQMTMLQSYDEVKIILIGNSKETEQFQYLRWIPHFWSNEKTLRFLASTADEIKDLSVLINKEIDKRLDKANENKDKLEPHYVVIATDKELTRKADFISKIINCDENCGFSLIFAYGEMKDLPKECSTVIEISDFGSSIYDKNDISDTKQEFEIETITYDTALQIAKELSNISLDLSSSSYVLPSMLSFLDMFGVGKIEHLNSLTRWKENNPVQSLQTPVGVDTSGEQFMLDLHEKAHGPHGLVAGMTGSGKSEFVITFILSLAVNYHPDEVSFILIDYKGGGLTGAFESDNFVLPHLAGTITNLDGSAIKRSLLSIESELKKRQAMFNEARRISNEGTMDIYKYQKLYRNGVVKEPVPHLFIISDEFAELKAQQPEFMEQLISTARIGRSLGVHLILATQKPSGVVDDQIWSNSRFRVCLKVQDKSDSMDMIKRADAAEISQTGRFYLQVGFNELFELGQSAWSGASYVEKESSVDKDEVKRISLLNNLGQEINTLTVKESANAGQESNLKQIVEINKYIYNLAKGENAFARKLWLEAIPVNIFYNKLKEKYSFEVNSKSELMALLGEVDDPARQQQFALSLNFTDDGNVLLFGSVGSGKAMFIITMLYSLLQNYNAEQLNVYILDFGSEIFGAFSKAPQIADVVFSSENEKIKNLFKLLNKEITRRKKLFSEYGGSYKEYSKNSTEFVPHILVIINNFAAFYESNEEYDEVLTQVLRDGSKYGIYFIVSANGYNDIRYRIIQNFNKQFVLQQNDISEYSIILGSTGGMIPAKGEGRGLLSIEKHIYEFQTARAFESEDTIQEINRFCNDLKSHSGVFAEKIPVLPERVDVDCLSSANKDFSQLAIGVNYNTLKIATVNFNKQPIQFVLSQDIDDSLNFCTSLIAYISTFDDVDISVFDTSNMIDDIENAEIVSSDFENRFDRIYELILERHNKIKTNNWIVPEGLNMKKNVCFIFGLSKFIESLSAEFKKVFYFMFEKLKSDFNVNFIIFESNVNTSNYSFESWYKNQVNQNGIWLGDGILDQYSLTITKRNKDMSREIDSTYGFIVNNGKAEFIKVLNNSED